MFRALASKLFGSKRESKSAAKSRLSFVLVQDRTGLTNDELRDFRGELVEVIGRYFVIDEQGFDIDYERMGETTTLVINSPVVVRRQEAVSGVAGARHRKPKVVSTGLAVKTSSVEVKEEAEEEAPPVKAPKKRASSNGPSSSGPSSNGHARRGKRRSRSQRRNKGSVSANS